MSNACLAETTDSRLSPMSAERAHNLPTPLTTFVGRDAELSALAAALRGARLVTVAGPGGCGKTRLAVEAASREPRRWPDGVWWVDLAATSDPVAVPELVAAAAGVLLVSDQGAVSSLVRQVGDRRMLDAVRIACVRLDGIPLAIELARPPPARQARVRAHPLVSQ
jgi:predicted ATPase